MTFNEARQKAKNPEAFAFGDKWMVKNSVTGQPIEGAKTESNAPHAVQNLNEHEQRNGRTAVFAAEALERI